MRVQIFFSLLVLLGLSALNGQDQIERPQTLISGQVRHGFFLAPVTKITHLEGETAYLAGGKIAWLINHRFAIGFAGYGRIDNFDWDWFDDHHGHPNQMGYGGLLLEGNFLPLKAVRINLGCLLGAGAINREVESGIETARYLNRNDWPHTDHDQTDVFVVIEPEVNLELGITRYCALGMGVGYRFTSGIDGSLGGSNTSMSGVSGSVTLKFGLL